MFLLFQYRFSTIGTINAKRKAYISIQTNDFLAHLSRKLKGELISSSIPMLQRPSSSLFTIFKHGYLRGQQADHNQILSEERLHGDLVQI